METSKSLPELVPGLDSSELEIELLWVSRLDETVSKFNVSPVV